MKLLGWAMCLRHIGSWSGPSNYFIQMIYFCQRSSFVLMDSFPVNAREKYILVTQLCRFNTSPITGSLHFVLSWRSKFLDGFQWGKWRGACFPSHRMLTAAVLSVVFLTPSYLSTIFYPLSMLFTFYCSLSDPSFPLLGVIAALPAAGQQPL